MKQLIGGIIAFLLLILFIFWKITQFIGRFADELYPWKNSYDGTSIFKPDEGGEENNDV